MRILHPEFHAIHHMGWLLRNEMVGGFSLAAGSTSIQSTPITRRKSSFNGKYRVEI